MDNKARVSRRWAGLAIFVAAATVAACGQPPATGGSVATGGQDAIYDAAKKEGQAVFYCGIPQSSCDALADAYTKKYPGVPVQSTRMPSSEMTTRFLSERKAHAPTADVLLTSDFPFVADGQDKKILKPWGDLLPSDYPKQYVAASVGSPFSVALNAMIYNTDKVSAADAPKTYSDLLDHPEKWKGKVCSASPAASPSIAVMWGTISDNNGGEQFYKKVHALGVRWFEGGNAPATAAVASGECAVQMLGNIGRVEELKKDGAPLKYVYPPGVTGAPFTIAVNSEPAHPNAQRLLAQFLISKQASELMVKLDPSTAVAYVKGEAENVSPPNFDYYKEPKLGEVFKSLGIKR